MLTFLLNFLLIYLAIGALYALVDIVTAYVCYGSISGWMFSHAPENVSGMIEKHGSIEVALCAVVVTFDVVVWPYLIAKAVQNMKNR